MTQNHMYRIGGAQDGVLTKNSLATLRSGYTMGYTGKVVSRLRLSHTII